ncbi:ATP-dependent RNA helicase HAS1 [Frankliniella fusca]|uniref:ATP-dependent RNA helicase HAS1 n=1 Tax=Frankliniella fusca TaxID=407009 RepID=A0AAE1HU78_9NEOP|nr:ATP-dependent RNA helicase HAS1 [Frankliniella fusca]
MAERSKAPDSSGSDLATTLRANESEEEEEDRLLQDHHVASTNQKGSSKGWGRERPALIGQGFAMVREQTMFLVFFSFVKERVRKHRLLVYLFICSNMRNSTPQNLMRMLRRWEYPMPDIVDVSCYLAKSVAPAKVLKPCPIVAQLLKNRG